MSFPKLLRLQNGSPRNIGVLIISITVVTLFSLILLASTLDSTPFTSRPFGSGKKEGNTDSPSSKVLNRNKLLVVLPKDQAKGHDYGFKEDWLERAVANRKSYAEHHAGLLDAYDRYPEVEWIWCLDADAIIMNATVNLYEQTLSLEALATVVKPNEEIFFAGHKQIPEHEKKVRTPEKVIPEDVYLVIAKDGNSINAGSFAVRRNEFMSAFLDLWRDPNNMNPKYSYWEQDALSHLILNHPHVLKHVGIVDQKHFNSYPGQFKPEDLVVHFAGCKVVGKNCDENFINFYNKRVVLPSG
ncbi:hypothetical protein FQN57_003500 [Myotisia sp. PD_48]|nr:hypothetical protein FQN57_003500 [Myotisia sp. PD_48]